MAGAIFASCARPPLANAFVRLASTRTPALLALGRLGKSKGALGEHRFEVPLGSIAARALAHLTGQGGRRRQPSYQSTRNPYQRSALESA